MEYKFDVEDMSIEENGKIKRGSEMRIKKAVEKYNNMKGTWNSGEGEFTPLDIMEVFETAQSEDPIDIAYAALKAGFVIGYMKVKRQESKERRERKREEYV